MRSIRLLVASVLVASSILVGFGHASAQIECTRQGTSGPDVLVGSPGPDVLCGLGGNDELRGRGGDDILVGGRGDDFLTGNLGDDVLKGGRGSDTLIGRAGDDVLRAGPGIDDGDAGFGDDVFHAGDGQDINIFGGTSGADVVYGDGGSDRCLATQDGRSNDAVFGGPGIDRYFIDPGDAHRGAEIEGPCFAE
jgi:Ca2+-binding RTX toxin-like protein